MPKSTSSSSDSEEDAEETKRLALAVDPDFLKASSKTRHSSSNGAIKSGIGDNDDEQPKSKRPKIMGEDDELQYSKPYSLEITPDGQKFIAKKLAESLDKRLKEISPPSPANASNLSEPQDSGIRLFSNSKSRVTAGDLVTTLLPPKRKQIKKKKKKKKRKRKKSGGSSSSSSESESDSEKLRSVAVTADWVLTNN